MSFALIRFILIKAKESGKVEFIAMAKILEITGDRFVSNIKYEDRNSDEIKELKVGGVFVAIGYAPNSGLVNGLVEINQNGKIIIDHQTQKPLLREFGRPAISRMFCMVR